VCGRYASSRGADHLVEHFEVEDPPEQLLPPSWNVAPTDPVHVVAVRHDRRRLAVARWGLVPSWAKDTKGAARLINARSETVRTTPAFRSAFARRRCLVPADGYYEWKREGSGKQPFFLSSRDGAPLAMAGLYEVRKDDAGASLWTCTVLTDQRPGRAGRDPRPHAAARAARAVGPLARPRARRPGDALLVPGVPGVLDAWPVGAAVGNVRNDGPQLVEPVETAPTLLEG
jgi:putative SOS response-associated peptidase YedK